MPDVFPTDVRVEIHRSEPTANVELVLTANGDRSSYAIKSGNGFLYAVTHTADETDSGTIAHDAITESINFTTTPDPFTFTHTPVGAPKGVLVFVVNNTDGDVNHVTSITYGGVLMFPLGGGSRGSSGGILSFYLLSGIPPGVQTVSIDHTATSSVKRAFVVTVTADRDLQIPEDTSTVSIGASYSYGLPSKRQAVRYAVALTDHNSTGDVAAAANNTDLASVDFGTEIARMVRRTTTEVNAELVGFDEPATVEAFIVVATALEEIPLVSVLEIYDIDPLSAPSFVGTVSDVDNLLTNFAEHGLVFDSTGRYLYALGGAGTLYTIDTNTPTSPTLVDTQVGYASPPFNGHYGRTIHRVGSDLYLMYGHPSAFGGSQIEKFDISTPAAPSSTQKLAVPTFLVDRIRNPISVGYVTPDDKWILYPNSQSPGVTSQITIIDLITGGLMTEETAVTLPEKISGLGNKFQPLYLAFLPNPTALTNRFLTLLVRIEKPNSIGLDVGSPSYFWMTYKTASANAWDTLALYSHEEAAGIADPSVIASALLSTGSAAGRLEIHRNNVAQPTGSITQTLEQKRINPHHARLVRAERGETYIYVFIEDDDIAVKGRLTVWEYTNLSLSIDSSVGRTTPQLLTSIIVKDLNDLGPLLRVGTTLLGIGGNTSLDTRSLVTIDEPGEWVELPTVEYHPGIMISYGISGSGPADRVADTGTMSFELRNSNPLGRFSPDHASLFAGFRVGREIRLAVDWDGATWYPWWGFISSITPQGGQRSPRRTAVMCVDFMDYLSRARTQALVTRFDESAAQGVHLLLNAAMSDPVGFYFLNKAGEIDTYPTLFDISKDELTALVSELQKLCQSDRAFVYVVGGVFYFEGRNIRSDAIGTIDLTLGDSELRGLVVDHSAENLINNAEARVHPRRFDAAAVTLFEYQTTQSIARNETIEFNAPYRDPDQKAARVGGFGMVTPVATTDYTFNTAEDGTGSDIVGQLSVSVTFGGNSAEVKILNSGPTDGFLTAFKLRGKGIYTFEPIAVKRGDAQSEAQHGPLQSVYDLPYHDQPAIAEDAVQYILHKYGDPTTFIRSVAFKANQNSTLMNFVIKTRVISALIDISETVTGLSGRDYFVQNAQITFDGKSFVRATLGVTPADTDIIFEFGDGLGGGSDMDGEDVLGSSFIS